MTAGRLLARRSVGLACASSKPIPCWDRWEFVRRAPDILAGRFSFADLVTQHNEHRIAAFRLVFILGRLCFDGASSCTQSSTPRRP